MRKRIVDLPFDFGSIVVPLFFVGLHPNIGLLNINEDFTDYFRAVEGDLYPTLHFQPQNRNRDPSYVMLLREFLTDPGRAGEHALDGPKYALVARFLLDCFIPPCSERNFVRYFNNSECSVLLSETGILLSKASHSDELVTRINHADINCENFTFDSEWISVKPEDYFDESLRTLIKGIGDYLMRVVGSLPIDLKITLQVYNEKTSVYPRPLTVGPLYYDNL